MLCSAMVETEESTRIVRVQKAKAFVCLIMGFLVQSGFLHYMGCTWEIYTIHSNATNRPDIDSCSCPRSAYSRMHEIPRKSDPRRSSPFDDENSTMVFVVNRIALYRPPIVPVLSLSFSATPSYCQGMSSLEQEERCGPWVFVEVTRLDGSFLQDVMLGPMSADKGRPKGEENFGGGSPDIMPIMTSPDVGEKIEGNALCGAQTEDLKDTRSDSTTRPNT
ncbi:hypothetical protein VNO77_16115 [Canavalia gladiata]|uniref:Uncharacterized protein n=1 Tax=Canavalia gladiata TaxID=3824 RepID=A0AAN9M0F0_CANGL